MKFYLFRNGDVAGPFDEQQLIDLWKSKSVGAEDFVKAEKSGDWVRLDSIIGGLIAAETARELPPHVSATSNSCPIDGGALAASRNAKGSITWRGLIAITIPVILVLLVLWQIFQIHSDNESQANRQVERTLQGSGTEPNPQVNEP